MSSDHPLLLEIQKGESQTLEFKEQLPKGQQVAKTLIAFANTSGGKLVVGVSDDRQLVGIQDDIFELQDQITSMINELCMPNILPYIYIENIQGIELLVIDVPQIRPVGIAGPIHPDAAPGFRAGFARHGARGVGFPGVRIVIEGLPGRKSEGVEVPGHRFTAFTASLC